MPNADKKNTRKMNARMESLDRKRNENETDVQPVGPSQHSGKIMIYMFMSTMYHAYRIPV